MSGKRTAIATSASPAPYKPCTRVSVMAFILVILTGCSGSGDSATPLAPMPGNGSSVPIEDGGNSGAQPMSLPDSSSCAEAFESVVISDARTLNNTDSACDYYIRGTVRIEAALIVEPGTVILMGQDARVVVDEGSLIAVGTAEQRIVIRGESQTTGFWQGIFFSDANDSRIEHVDIMDAGNFANRVSSAQPGAITARASTLSLIDTSISNSLRDGAYLSSQLGDITLSAFSNNRFFGNAGKPITVDGSLLPMLDATTDYLGMGDPNGDPVVQVEYTATSPDRYTLRAINVPYRPVNAISAFGEQEITLEPGVQLELGISFGRKTGASNGGRYVAIGTPEQPIIFTHSNLPEAQDTESAVEAIDGGSVVLQHVQLNGLPASVGRNGNLQINDAVISDSPGYGIQCVPLAMPVLGNNNVTFIRNASGEYSPECSF